jgi:hypothetical protein
LRYKDGLREQQLSDRHCFYCLVKKEFDSTTRWQQQQQQSNGNWMTSRQLNQMAAAVKWKLDEFKRAKQDASSSQIETE